MANHAARMEQKCRELDAMDPAARREVAEWSFGDAIAGGPPEWTRQLIPYFEAMKHKYRGAAAHPRRPLAPNPPRP